MLLVSQNKEQIIFFGGEINRIQYIGSEETDGRHRIYVTNRCPEPIAEYPTKERCMAVLRDLCEAFKAGCYTMDFYDSAAQSYVPGINRRNIVFEFPER